MSPALAVEAKGQEGWNEAWGLRGAVGAMEWACDWPFAASLGPPAVWGQAGKGSQLAILAWLEKGASRPAGERMEQAGQRPGPQSYSWSCLN